MSAENEYEREGAGPMPIQAADVGALGGIDEQAPDVDSEVAEEVRLQEETREADAVEEAAENPGDDDAVTDPAEDEPPAETADDSDSEGDDDA